MSRLLASPSKTAIWLLFGLLILGVVVAEKFRDETVLKQDIVQYYSYVPATFLHNDMGMSYARDNAFWGDKIWGTPSNGAYIQKYTMGMAIMYTPFFAAGHATAKLTGAPDHGYSWPYTLWLGWGAVVYVVLGLVCLRKVLLEHFSEWVTAAVLVTLVSATNLLYYTAMQGPMPHAHIFCLFSIFLYLTVRFHRQPDWKNSFLLGVAGSMVILIRPSHIFIFMVPLLYGIDKEKLNWWWTNKWRLLAWPLAALLVAAPQLIYWKVYSGNWLFYSYGEEGFFWSNPVFWKVWFSFRKGWLIYTPAMAFAVVGLFQLRKHAKEWFWPSLGFFALSSYIIASWWCWWYGGSFGSRPYVDLYPILGLGLGAFLTWMARSAMRWRIAVATLAAFALLNVFQTWQYSIILIHYDSMNWASYKAVFGTVYRPANWEALLDPADYDAAMQGDR